MRIEKLRGSRPRCGTRASVPDGCVDAAARGGHGVRPAGAGGAVPTDLDGVYLRNTENQIHEPLGRYHPFDGDAMIHQLDFRRGQVSYRNRFVARAASRPSRRRAARCGADSWIRRAHRCGPGSALTAA